MSLDVLHHFLDRRPLSHSEDPLQGRSDEGFLGILEELHMPEVFFELAALLEGQARLGGQVLFGSLQVVVETAVDPALLGFDQILTGRGMILGQLPA
jgi:hypothetical protein